MRKATKKARNKFFANLRAEWKKSKDLSVKDKKAKALYREAGIKFSYLSFYFTLLQMRKQNLEGIPYVDCKTFNGWHEAGFVVKKGEHHKIQGVSWIAVKDENGEEAEDSFRYPKVYNLFHKSQVEPIVVQ